jgi:hypothetical protein
MNVYLFTLHMSFCSIHDGIAMVVAATSQRDNLYGLRENNTGYIFPGVDTEYYFQRGDLYVGIYLRQRECKPKTNLLRQKGSVYIRPNTRLSQGIRYIVDKLNDEQTLPHNLTLGFIVMNACPSARGLDMNVGILQLLKQSKCETKDIHSVSCGKNQDATFFISIVSHGNSGMSITASSIQTVSRIPVIAISASSDTFSNKRYFPYFSRMIPPVKYELFGVLSLVKHFGWTYVHVLHTKGEYGEAAFVALKQGLLKLPDVCMASEFQVNAPWTPEEIKKISAQITSDTNNSRVVIAVLEERQVEAIINQINQRVSPPGQLIWVLTNSANNLDNLPFIEGSLLVQSTPGTIKVPDFDRWFEQQSLEKAFGDPWFLDLFAHFCNCSSTNSNSCNHSFSIGKCGKLKTSTYSGVLFDGITLAATAARRVLESDCDNGEKPRGKELEACLKPQRILEEIRRTTITGYTGVTKLNSDGDRLVEFAVLQMTKTLASNGLTWLRVATYFPTNDTVKFVENFTWPNGTAVISLCSHPCRPRQGKQFRSESICCWDCVDCDEWEHVENGKCAPCPEYQWPNSTGQGCNPIPLTFDRHTSNMGMFKTVTTLLLITLCLGVGFFIQRDRHSKIIKASSIELSYIMLSGLLLGYCTVLLSMGTPSDIWCRTYFCLYCTSFTMLYGPLTVRTLRIYSIFFTIKKSAAQKSKTKSYHVVLYSIVLVLVMITVCFLSQLKVDHKWCKQHQPIRTKKLVEIVCQPRVLMLAFAFTYNTLLLLVSAVLAVRMRHLPQNFNEAGFISVSACSSLTLAFCLLPVFTTSDTLLKQKHVLDLALVVNHTANLFTLFVPKIYAVYDEKCKLALDPIVFKSQTQSLGRKDSKWNIFRVSSKSNQTLRASMVSGKFKAYLKKSNPSPAETGKTGSWVDSGVYMGPTASAPSGSLKISEGTVSQPARKSESVVELEREESLVYESQGSDVFLTRDKSRRDTVDAHETESLHILYTQIVKRVIFTLMSPKNSESDNLIGTPTGVMDEAGVALGQSANSWRGHTNELLPASKYTGHLTGSLRGDSKEVLDATVPQKSKQEQVNINTPHGNSPTVRMPQTGIGAETVMGGSTSRS